MWRVISCHVRSSARLIVANVHRSTCCPLTADLFGPSGAASPRPDGPDGPVGPVGRPPAVEQLRESRWASNTIAIYDVLRAEFERARISPEDAAALAQSCVVSLGEYAGGRELYLPKAKSLRAALRHDDIRAAYRGNNAQELADRYGVTRRWIEKIVHAHRPRGKS